jgi:hypothetical protein
MNTKLDADLRLQLLLGSLGAALVGVAYLWLPGVLTVGPNWLLLAIDAVVLLPLLITAFFRPLPLKVARLVRGALQVVLTLALFTSMGLYVVHLPQFKGGVGLLRPAALLWISNILIFAVWYWEIDGDGPVVRKQRGHPAVDFLFPQQARGHAAWGPGFVDYLFLAFCFATALSPADTAPLTARAKLLMMVEAIISLLILVLLVSRSVNILA